jgi:pantoate--beta-alanine ligase
VSKSKPKLVRTIKELRKAVARWRSGKTIALVPTMGALHDGHLALVKRARKKADRVVVSIFVNPAQFAPSEDLSRYPRDEDGDLAKLAHAGVDLVWAPSAAEMYPDGFATTVVPEGAAKELEADIRPHHFGGVATICLKLFSSVTPDAAVFGEKDFQQLCVLRQMVRDLNLPIEIISVPTVREPDGLALSTRNGYLSHDDRVVAPALNRALRNVAEAVCAGTDPKTAAADAKRDLERAGFTKVDYVEVRDSERLSPYVPTSGRPGRALAAAWLGETRLIDNVELRHIEPDLDY